MRVFGANTFNQMQNVKREFLDEDNRKVNSTVQNENWSALCKMVPNGLSQCHTKRRMGTHGCAHPSFGMTPTFHNKKIKKT